MLRLWEPLIQEKIGAVVSVAAFLPSRLSQPTACHLPFRASQAVSPAGVQRHLLAGAFTRCHHGVAVSSHRHLSYHTPIIQAYHLFKKGAGVNDRDGLTDMSILHFVCKSGARGVGSDVSAHTSRPNESRRAF